MSEFFYQFLPSGLILLGQILVCVGTAVSVKRKNKSMFKYKTLEDAPAASKASVQSISEEVVDYVLNPDTNRLEELEVKKNLQKDIQSYIDCALERALERFHVSSEQPDESRESLVEGYSAVNQDLSVLADAMEVAEQYRDEFGLPDTASLSDIYGEVDRQAKLWKNRLSSFNKAKEENKDGTLSSPPPESSVQSS